MKKNKGEDAVPEEDKSDSQDFEERFRASAAGQGNHLVFKGTLLKENWYRNKQLRYIELTNNGEMKYHDIEKTGKYVYKSSLWIDSTTIAKRIDSKNMHIKCVKKGKTYYFIEPSSK